MLNAKTLILDAEQIKQKIKRLAYEVYENNFQEESVVIAGIYDKGYELAGMLSKELLSIAPLKVTLVKVELDKLAPLQSEIAMDPVVQLENRTVILVDDVLNTGRTLAYSLKPFLNVRVKKIEIAVLVNRSHTQFPVSCNYTGYELATTINEHVEVLLEGPQMGVYL